MPSRNSNCSKFLADNYLNKIGITVAYNKKNLGMSNHKKKVIQHLNNDH